MTRKQTHSSRHDRDFGRKCSGDEGYTTDELVAELGSASLASHNRKRFKAQKYSELPTLTEADIATILHVACKHGALTIGAPSSPILSNAILYDFDCFVAELCQANHVAYSRYADDLFLSTDQPNQLADILEAIRTDIRNRVSPRLTINENKTVFTSKKRRRVVAGLVLTSDGRLSIGREKKRSIRTLIHLYSTGMLPPDDISYLRGYLAFVNSVEPDFLERVRRKYGDETISNLLSFEPTVRKTYGSRK